MHLIKNTQRAAVQATYDGRFVKTFRGPAAKERFSTEVQVLRLLEQRGCTFVPKLLNASEDDLSIVISNCGQSVVHLDRGRASEIFSELESFGVRHDDPETRNVTYRHSDGRFCVIDFEFATILE